jgi:amino acid adenylation domain-containing protein
VALGYAGQPALTAIRFVPDPWAGGGIRMYRTGDRVRLLDDGSLEFLGRMDAQVKVRGFRVEPGEVEAALASHPQVAAGGVVADANRLVAFVVPAGPGLDAADLRAHLAARLPAHMIPVVVSAADLPRTVNGKLDRAALLGRARDACLADAAATPYRTPGDGTEAAIAAIWSEVLGRDRVGADDNFFELGGDSIRALQVAALARERGLTISVADVFDALTVAELAALAAGVTGGRQRAASRPFELVDPADRRALPEDCVDAYPLTVLQQGMVFHQLSDTAYLNVTGVAVRAVLDADLLRAAISHVMARHAVLRTSFDLANYTEPLQLVHRDVAPPLTVLDVPGGDGAPVAADETAARVAAWMRLERDRPLDLTRPPLFRVTVHRAGADRFWFCVTECHAILDGWSFTSTVAEILRSYASLLAGDELPPPRPPATLFRDYVADERAALADPAARRHWTELLAGAEPVELPTRRHPPLAVADRRVVPLPLDTQRGLQRLADRLGVQLKNVLLAAHAAVLGLWTGRPEVLTGLVVNGRPETAGAEDTRGMYLNTLPARIKVAGQTGITLVKECFQAETDLLRHRTYPGSALERRSAHGRLFTAAFNYTRFRTLGEFGDRSGTSTVRLASEFQEIAPVNYPLYVSFDHGTDERHGHLALLLAASTQHFADWEADQLVELFRAVLGWLAERAEEPLTTRDLMGPAGRAEILNDWGGRARERDTFVSVPARFRECVSRSPAATAVTDADGTLSYAQLAAAVDGLAAGLAQAGVARGDVVAVCLPRRSRAIAAVLAVWHCGATYVPLDPAQPPGRAELICAGARPKVIVVDADTLGVAPPGSTVVRADKDPDTADGAPPCPSRPPVAPADVAYVMFTSGSTGRPKGVAVPHSALAAFIDAATTGWSPGDRILAVTTIGFDISIVELLLPLTVGAQVILHDAEGVLDPVRLRAALRNARATRLQATPGVWGALAETPGDLEGLRGWCGGEALPAPLAETLVGRGVQLSNWYGPTETTIWSTVMPLSDAVLDRAVAPIGRPLAGERVYVLDELLDVLPAGIVGDLYIAGDGVAQGYLDQPGLTAGRFVPDRFAAAGTRMYRTGDRARWRMDGVLEFRGRVDGQVKVRGVRIEVTDVESVIRAHQSVAQVGVALRDDRLVAFVVAQDGAFDPAAIRRSAAPILPAAAIPAIVRVPQLPFNANGKLDRTALAHLDLRHDPAGQTHVPARTPVETELARLWQDILGVELVGRTDNFFDLGGDSLRALRLAVKATSRGFPLRPGDVFATPMLADLAAVAATATAPPAGAFDDGPGSVPILPRQRVFLDRVGTDPALEHLFQYLEVREELRPEAVLAALTWTARQHSALRMRWHRADSGWRQEVVDTADLVTFRVLDLRALSAAQRTARLTEFARSARATTDLGDSPPWSVTLVRLAPGHARLLFAVHHLVVDGYSWQVLLTDFLSAYEHIARGEPPAARPIDGFAAWARACGRLSHHPRVQELASRWADVLAGCDPVPVDADGSPPTRGAQYRVPLRLDAARTADLRGLRDEGQRVSMEVVLSVALARAYGRWTGGKPLLLAVLTQGRDGFGGVAGPEPDATSAVGWFAGMFPVRIEVASGEDPRGTLHRVNRLIPREPLIRNSFGLLRYLADGTPGAALLGGLRQPQVLLNYTGDHPVGPTAPVRRLEPPPARTQDPDAQPEALIEIELAVVDDVLDGRVIYSGQHFGQRRAEEFTALIKEELTLLAHA